MKKSKTLVFFGNERLATGLSTDAPVLRALVSAGYDVAAVVISQNDVDNHRKARVVEIVEIANNLNIPVLSPPKLNQIKNTLVNTEAAAGILVAYGKMIPQNIIDVFPRGIINIHPSLLPKHRGPTPIESVILHGDKTTGVSLMQLTPNMDSGPIYAQKTIQLKGTETKATLANTLINMGKDMLIDNLSGIIDGTSLPKPQNDELATYDNLINKSSGLVDTIKPASLLAREIRAFSEWPRSHIKISNLDVIITQASAVAIQLNPGELRITEQKELLIGTTEGSLNISELMPIGKQKMSASAFINGYGARIN